MIFEIHQMMLDDLDYLESIEGIIRTQSVNAEYAVSTTADNFAQMFASMDDAYMQGRAADVKDVSERVLDILCGVSNGTREMTEPCIVAADDLAPSETVQLDKEKVLGFATMYGSSNSHTAILARTMNIPAVIGMGEALNPKYDGEMAIIDGFTGTLYVDPDEETLAKMQEKRAKDLEQKELLNQLKGKENVTKTGQKINVYANIGNVSDLGAVLKNDAGGVGLFRSEFLYLENSTYPTEEQQFAAYKQVVESMAGKKVIIDTSGHLLEMGLEAKPTMIKPNIDEIRMLTGKSCDNFQDMVDAAKQIHADGVEIVAVSLGGDGSFVVCDDGIFRARVPKIDAVNTVGCGDSMIAGFALGLSEGLSVEETLKKASAISAAAALREETGFFVKEDMEKIYPQVEIEKIG